MFFWKPKLFTTLKDYTKKQFFQDVNAGIIVAIIALPLSIALAISSGVSPEKGLHTAIIAGFLISFLGGSRVQIGGPTGAFMVIVYGIVMEFGIEGLMISTIMAGIMMMAMGFLRLGSIIKFIPFPIITGFTSGIAVVIFSSQMKDFLGLSLKKVPVDFLDQWTLYLQQINQTHLTTLFIGLLALVIIILWPRWNQKVPGALIALITTSVLVMWLDLPVATIGTQFGALSSSLPKLQPIHVNSETIRLLIQPALTIAILGSVESLLSAVVSDAMIGGKHRSNTELIAQGIANIASGLFGGIPATGAIARTVANIKNGGRTPIAGMVHAITLLFILVLFMPLAQMVPLASLSAILMVVAYNMSEWRQFLSIFRSTKSDVIILLTTFLLTILVDLVVAIEIGMILAAFLFMKRMSEVSHVQVTDLDAAEQISDEDDAAFVQERSEITGSSYIQVYEINGPFFFGAADKFISAFAQVNHQTDVLILRMRNVPSMDGTALNSFRHMMKMAKDRQIKLVLSGLNPQPQTVLRNAGLVERIGLENMLPTFTEAVNRAKELSRSS